MKKKPTKRVSTSIPERFPNLQPMTKQRECVAAEMGMKWGFTFPYRVQSYLRDVIIFLWLRTIPVEAKKGWSVDQAESNPAGAMKEALGWATTKAIGLDSPAFFEGWRIFTATMKEIQAAKGDPIIPADTKRPDPDESEC